MMGLTISMSISDVLIRDVCQLFGYDIVNRRGSHREPHLPEEDEPLPLHPTFIGAFKQHHQRHYLWAHVSLPCTKYPPPRLHSFRKATLSMPTQQRMAARDNPSNLLGSSREEWDSQCVAITAYNQVEAYYHRRYPLRPLAIPPTRHPATTNSTTIPRALQQDSPSYRQRENYCLLLTSQKHWRVCHSSQVTRASWIHSWIYYGGVSRWIGFILTPPIFHSAAGGYAYLLCRVENSMFHFLCLQMCFGQLKLITWHWRELYTILVGYTSVFARSASKGIFYLAVNRRLNSTCHHLLFLPPSQARAHLMR